MEYTIAWAKEDGVEHTEAFEAPEDAELGEILQLWLDRRGFKWDEFFDSGLPAWSHIPKPNAYLAVTSPVLMPVISSH